MGKKSPTIYSLFVNTSVAFLIMTPLNRACECMVQPYMCILLMFYKNIRTKIYLLFYTEASILMS